MRKTRAKMRRERPEDPVGGSGSYQQRVKSIGEQAGRTASGALKTGINHFMRFMNLECGSQGNWLEKCDHKDRADFLTHFGLYLADNTEANYTSIGRYMGEARQRVEIMNGCKRIELLAKHVAVLKELKRRRQKQPKRKKPLTAGMLRRWRKRLEREGSPATAAEWASFITMSLCFYGLLRVSEVIGRKQMNEGLKWKHLNFVVKNGKVTSVEVFVERSKTDPCGFGATVVIYAVEGDPSSPVDWLFQMRQGKSEDEYVVQGNVKGKPVNYAKVNGDVKAQAALAGEDPKMWGTHSGRAGGATSMHLAGATGEEVRAAGRWSSDTYRRYIRLHPRQRKSWMEGMAKSDKPSEWASDFEAM